MINDADTPAGPSNRRDADLLELLLVLAREKKLVLGVTIGATLVAVIVVFIVPKMYTATTTILPPQQNQSVLSAMLGQLAGAQSLDLRDLGLKNPSDVFVAMLKSRTVEDALINRFDLRKVYYRKRYQDTRRILEKRSEIDPEKEGLISIQVSDRDPKRAAEIANAWVEELRKLNQNLALTEAAQRRVFFEQKLAQEREELANAEVALKQIEQKTGVIQPDAQTRALITAVADVRAQIAARQVQLQSLRTYATENNPDVKRVQTELAELQAQYAKLSQMGHGASDSEQGNVQVPTGRVAAATLEYLRVAREVKYHESLYDFLARQLEAARIDEAKNAVVVQVVDRAVEPERKSSPRRMLIVAVTAGLAFLLACFGVLVREAIRRRGQDPGEAARLAQLNQYLRSPLT
ncbi:MAG TPA: Wzz/FepE/Etk N-terminal domain-containing protein [Candidatus Eisenbacteria bacterium]|nr:Wzz/FepE/Etk N-terminal domain-containing protein [Candidatus Eisenbacteria bacterium]